LISTPSRLRLAAVSALLASSLLHVAAMAVSPDLGEEVLIEGGADAREATLGNSFADLIKAGDTLDPVETTQAAGASPSPVTPQPAEFTAIQPVKQPRDPVPPAASAFENVAAQAPSRLEPVSEAGLIPPSRTEKLDVSVSDVSVTRPTPEMTRPVKPAESLKPVEDPCQLKPRSRPTFPSLWRNPNSPNNHQERQPETQSRNRRSTARPAPGTARQQPKRH
jgi:hypothetical protein